MTIDRIDLEVLKVELKTYAHGQVADHLRAEYDDHIEYRWKPHISELVAAQEDALKRHQKVLDDVRKQIEKEREALFGLAMLALSFVSGPALSWIAGRIQYHWFPKFATSQKLKGREVYLIKKDDLFGKEYDLFEHDHDKAHAKVFGDLGAQIAGLGIDKALKVVIPNDQKRIAQNAVQVASTSGPANFRARLENAMKQEAKITSDAIENLAKSIHQHSSYGAECLEKLKRVNAESRKPTITKQELERLAKDLIDGDIDKLRRQWANDWFYYGHDPPASTAGMVEQIETELWGLWILNERLQRYIREEVRDRIDDVTLVPAIDGVKGATFGYPGVPEQVLQKLADFGVVEARTQLQKLRAITAAGVREEQEKARKLKEQKEDDDAAAAYRKAMEDAEGAEDPARERAYLTRKKYEEDQKRKKRRDAERQAHPQPILVGSAVDTQAEIDALESWALQHSVIARTGMMAGTKRQIGSIRDYRGGSRPKAPGT